MWWQVCLPIATLTGSFRIGPFAFDLIGPSTFSRIIHFLIEQFAFHRAIHILIGPCMLFWSSQSCRKYFNRKKESQINYFKNNIHFAMTQTEPRLHCLNLRAKKNEKIKNKPYCRTAFLQYYWEWNCQVLVSVSVSKKQYGRKKPFHTKKIIKKEVLMNQL